MTQNGKHVIVVGGGASGMAAALFALRQEAQVTLLEHNEKLGKKLYITGKGRCNVTNACDLDTFLANVPRNPRFLHAAFAFLPPQALMNLLSELGCPTVVERGRRVFPASQKASDVTKALTRALAAADIRLNTHVTGITVQDGICTGVLLGNSQAIASDAVVVATGGVTYPVTGSTGDGYIYAQALGHKVSTPLPCLVPIETADAWPRQLQGLTLTNVVLQAKRGKKVLFHQQGELLFTHFGVSGPLVLSLSSYIAGLVLSELSVSIDLKPAVTHEQLMQRLNNVLAENGRKQLSSILPQFMPMSLAQVFPGIAGIKPNALCSQLTRAQRQRLIDTLKGIPLKLSAFRPLDEAVITRGGVAVSQVHPSSMQSKLVGGLYFAGEVLDVDALTGGYNLQIAFSTGALAGHHAAQQSLT